MLVANPGQTASYGLHSKKPCHSTTSSAASTSSINTTVTNGTSKNAINNLSNKSSRIALTNICVVGSTSDATTKALPPKLAPPTADNTTNKHHSIAINNYSNTSNNNTTSSNTATSTSNALMKTLSVRLNRGTEFLKETVQKALISKLPSHLSSVLNLNLYTVPPTATHRFPTERINTSSADSLHTEMCHFMPIRTAPTTPLKSNSKSRGASLKMPKACVAKKVHLNSYDGAVDQTIFEVDGHLQFRPKPNSTLLTTIFTTPERKSAFVCLVTNMKTIASVQSNPRNTTEPSLRKTRSRANRGLTKSKANVRKSVAAAAAAVVDSKTLTEIFVRKPRSTLEHGKKPSMLMEPIITRSSVRSGRTSSTAATRVAYNVAQSLAKMSLSNSRSSRISKQRSNNKKINLNNNNNNNNNNTNTGHPRKQRRKLKRKLPNPSVDDAASDLEPDVARPPPRKSARLSKDCKAEVMMRTQTSVATHNSRRYVGKRKSTSKEQKRTRTAFSPPLTRSRLKKMTELKLNSALTFKRI